MDIVILDGYTTNPGDLTWDPMREHGSLEVYDRTPREQVVERSSGADVLLTNKTPLDRSTLDELDELEFVSMLATGYDNVDVVHARELGVPVANIPEYATESVAEHTIGLILELFHHVGSHVDAVERGAWSECPDFTFWRAPIRELFGKTIGIVGFGRIGRRVGRIANALGMPVLGATHSSEPRPEYQPFDLVEPSEIFERADIVSLHTPLTPQTEQMVDAEVFETMKDEAVLVNTGRGEVVDEPALAEALKAGEIRAAAVDVVAEEPIREDNPLLDAPRCLITPHNAWASVEARERLVRAAADNVEAYIGGSPINVVN